MEENVGPPRNRTFMEGGKQESGEFYAEDLGRKESSMKRNRKESDESEIEEYLQWKRQRREDLSTKSKVQKSNYTKESGLPNQTNRKRYRGWKHKGKPTRIYFLIKCHCNL